MIFNSYSFVVFAFIFFLLFFTIPRRYKLGLLLASSYFFYAWWNVWFLGLIFISTLVDYTVAQKLDAETDEKRRKRWLYLSIATNLGILGYFKYFNFFADSFHDLFAKLGFETSAYYLDVLLPVGISFYTFQTLAYTIDVHRQKIKPEKSLLKFGLYVAYFPQLVAGPIERANQLLPQFHKDLKPTGQQIKEGVWLVTWGFFLKVVIADNLAPVVESTFGHHNPYVASKDVWIAVLAFCLQIYGDFAGYSKIARGVSKFIGIDLQMNFWNPLFAFSPSDFWRRWHITLSQWLRDYLYISLGGNRVGKYLTLRNLMITMILGGLWHGASWVFLLWGLYHGILLVFYKLFIDRFHFEKRKLTKGLLTLVMFFLTLYGWLIFRAENFEQLVEFTKQFLTFNFNGFLKPQGQIYAFWLFVFYLIIVVHDYIAEKRQSEYTLSFHKWYHLMPLFALFAVIYLFGAQQNEFIYFQF